MTKLKTVIIDISKLNSADNIEVFTQNMPFEIRIGMSSCDENGGTFLITDNRRAADEAISRGIGFSAYKNDENDGFEFPEALYLVDNLSDMSPENLNRMYLRANNLPWEILRTKRTLVREMTVEDVDVLYEIYKDEDVKRYIEDLYADRAEEIQYTKDYIVNQYRFYEYGMWIVEDIDTGKIIGRAGIFDRPNQQLQEMGFVFAKEVWGKGIACEVLDAVIAYAKEELSIESLYAHVIHENVRSRKLLEKLGFNYDGESELQDKIYDRYIKIN